MAKSDNSNQAPTISTTNGIGGVRQDLQTGLSYDSDGNVVTADVPAVKANGATVGQVDQIGVYDRHVYTDGSVATVQTRPANVTSSAEVEFPVPLPGEKQDVSGTGQDAATKPKFAPNSKTGKAAEKASDK